MSVKDLVVKSDSQLIMSQVFGDFQTKDSRMVAYLELTKELLFFFRSVDVKHSVREENVHADALANLGSMVEAPCKQAIPAVVNQWPAVWGEKRTSKEVHTIEEEF